MASIIKLTGRIYSDITGKFPFRYLIGNRYLMVIFECNRNDIRTEAIKNSELQSIANAYETL